MSFLQKTLVFGAISVYILSCNSSGSGQQARLRHEHHQMHYAADTNIGVYMHQPPYKPKELEYRPQFRFPDSDAKEPLTLCEKKYDKLLAALDYCYAKSTESSTNFSLTSDCIDYELTRRHCHIPRGLAEATSPDHYGNAGDWLKELPIQQTYTYRKQFVLRLLADFRCDHPDLPRWGNSKYKHEICDKALSANRILKAEGMAYANSDRQEEKAENRERKIQDITFQLMSPECRRYGRVCSGRRPTVYEPNPSCDLYRDCWDNYYEKALRKLKYPSMR